MKTNSEIAATSKVERGHLTRNMDVTQLLLCRGEKKKIDFEEDPLQVGLNITTIYHYFVFLSSPRTHKLHILKPLNVFLS